MSTFQEKYYYHLTPKHNLESIKREGLKPFSPKRFAALSPEAQDGKPKIYLLPTLRGVGMRGFLQEWWHGDIEDLIVLRCKLLHVHQSQDLYYARQEVWVYNLLDASLFDYKALNQPKTIWKPLQ